MNKGELVEKVAEEGGMSKADAERAVNGMLDAIGEALGKGDKVTLVGFGTIAVSVRAARQGRNPQTGKTMEIPARTVVKFKAGSKLVDSVQ